MEPFLITKEPEAFLLLADKTRRQILCLLRKREMTVGQMAKELDITSQATYHHVKKLLNGKMIEIVREVRVGHIMENHYRATADEIILSHGKTDTEALQHAVRLATSKR